VCGRRFRWRESLKQHTKTHQQHQRQEQHEAQQSEGQQWQQCAHREETGHRQHDPVTEPVHAPASETGTDVMSLTQVIPYLETIRVEYY
jgi:hypothetical protein